MPATLKMPTTELSSSTPRWPVTICRRLVHIIVSIDHGLVDRRAARVGEAPADRLRRWALRLR
jgi:hypothetical protein